MEAQTAKEGIPIKYIGKKERKADTVNHTDTVWKPGETVFYPRQHARALLRHTDVWRIGKPDDVSEENQLLGADVIDTEPKDDDPIQTMVIGGEKKQSKRASQRSME